LYISEIGISHNYTTLQNLHHDFMHVCTCLLPVIQSKYTTRKPS